MLSQEQILLRDTTRSFAQTHLAPRAAQRDRDGHAPRAMLNELAALGYLGMLLPAQWGGTELDYVSYAIAVAEVAAADGACSATVSVHNSLACRPILNFGDEGQKQLYLPAMARGDMLGAFCLTEPEAGSDASALRTRARRDGDHYVLNGTKQFITLGSSADIAVVFAVTDPQAGKRGISAFIVPTDTPGYEIASIERTMGQRGWDHCQIVFRDCRIPAKNLLGDEGQGLTIALSNLETGRIGVAAQAFGMARAAYEFALAYAGERRSFGKAIFEHQAVAFRLADMATQLQAAELMILAAAQLRDAGLPCLKEASMAKLFATEMAERICSDAMQTLGGYGYLADFPLERLYRDVRVCKIYEGTSDIQRLVISRQIAPSHAA